MKILNSKFPLLYTSFVIETDLHSFESLSSPDIWPDNAFIKSFYEKRINRKAMVSESDVPLGSNMSIAHNDNLNNEKYTVTDENCYSSPSDFRFNDLYVTIYYQNSQSLLKYLGNLRCN